MDFLGLREKIFLIEYRGAILPYWPSFFFKGGSEIKDPRGLSAQLYELRRVSGGRRDHRWTRKGKMLL
jgi:hypothetical protein